MFEIATVPPMPFSLKLTFLTIHHVHEPQSGPTAPSHSKSRHNDTLESRYAHMTYVSMRTDLHAFQPLHWDSDRAILGSPGHGQHEDTQAGGRWLGRQASTQTGGQAGSLDMLTPELVGHALVLTAVCVITMTMWHQNMTQRFSLQCNDANSVKHVR